MSGLFALGWFGLKGAVRAADSISEYNGRVYQCFPNGYRYYITRNGVWKGMNGNIVSTEGNGVWREYPSRKIVYSKPAFKTEQQRTMAEKSGRAAYIGEMYNGSNYVPMLVELSTGRPIWKLERDIKHLPDGTEKIKCTKEYYVPSENHMSFLDGKNIPIYVLVKQWKSPKQSLKP